MPAYDLYHETVRKALEKDGWTITHDPYYLSLTKSQMYVDLGAEKIVAAEQAGRKIAVEIKSFTGASALTEYHAALGQFLNYRLALETEDPERKLFLAVSDDVYTTVFDQPIIRLSTERYELKLLIFKPETQEVVKWKS